MGAGRLLFRPGELAEWLMAPVLKTARPALVHPVFNLFTTLVGLSSGGFRVRLGSFVQ